METESGQGKEAMAAEASPATPAGNESIADMFERLFPVACTRGAMAALVTNMQESNILTRQDLSEAFSLRDAGAFDLVLKLFTAVPNIVLLKVQADLRTCAKVKEQAGKEKEGDAMRKAATKNETLEGQLQALLQESTALDSAVAASKTAKSVSSPASRGAAANKKAAPRHAEKPEEIVKWMANMPYIKALELHEPAAADVLAKWYHMHQEYVISTTQMLDLGPERKQLQLKVQKHKKILEAVQSKEKLENQLEKEMAGRKNKDSIDNLVQQIAKSRTAVSRLVHFAGYEAEGSEPSARIIAADLTKLNMQLHQVHSEYTSFEAQAKSLQQQRDELEKKVQNLVKRGYHAASLKHHPDKQSDDVTEEQAESNLQHWQVIQRAYAIGLEPSLLREYLDCRDHEKFSTRQQEKDSGAVTSDIDSWQKRLTGATPHQCTMPMICEENYSLRDKSKVSVHLIWTCKNAVSLEVTRYELHIRVDRALSSLRSPEDQLSSFAWPDSPEIQLQLPVGEYVVRVRAHNIVGAGPWSQPLELVLRAEDANDSVLRKASKDVMRLAKERALEYRREEARAQVHNKLSTLACRHSLAHDNLRNALREATTLGLPISDDDRVLFARAERKLEEMLVAEELRKNLKDWKKRILPFPPAHLLEEMDSSEVSANLSNMMMQHLCKQAKEFGKAKLTGNLAVFDDILRSLDAAKRRTDLFKPNWCMDFQDLSRKLEVRVEQERKRRAKEEEKYEKRLAEERAELLAQQQKIQNEREEQKKMQEQRRQREAVAAAAKVSAEMEASRKASQDWATMEMSVAAAVRAEMWGDSGCNGTAKFTSENADDVDDSDVNLMTDLLLNQDLPVRAPAASRGFDLQGSEQAQQFAVRAPTIGGDMLSRQQEQTLFNQNMAKPFTQIDLGNPLESLCMLERAQVLNLMGPVDLHAPRGARFLELQSRFPQVVIELSADDGMLHITAQDSEVCTRVAELARVFACQPLSWDVRDWCVCSRCQVFSNGCSSGSKGLMHWWLSDAKLAAFVGKVQDFCARFPRINVRVEPVEKRRHDGMRLLVLSDTSQEGLQERVRSCLMAAAILEVYVRTPADWSPTGWCACGKCQTPAGCVGRLSAEANLPRVPPAASANDLEEQDAKTCQICMEKESDTRMAPCLHKICSDCVQLVKESTRMMGQAEDCCPFCRVPIKGFVGIYAQSVHEGRSQARAASAAEARTVPGKKKRVPLQQTALCPQTAVKTGEDRWAEQIAAHLKAKGGKPIEIGILVNPNFQGVPRPSGVTKKLRDVIEQVGQAHGLVLTTGPKGTKYVSLAPALRRSR